MERNWLFIAKREVEIATKVKSGETEVVVPDDSTVDETVDALAEIYPELADAERSEDGDVVTLTVAHGKKG